MEPISNQIRAQVLVDALPYIQKYNDKIVVVKYGGNAMTNEKLKQAVMNDIVLLSLVGVKVVLVHGGGPEISEMLKKLQIESRFIGGLRYTDQDTVDVVKMVLAGKVCSAAAREMQLGCAVLMGICCVQNAKSAPMGKIWALSETLSRSMKSQFWTHLLMDTFRLLQRLLRMSSDRPITSMRIQLPLGLQHS